MDEKTKTILNKLTRTRRGETICLMEWEVRLILAYIDELRTKVLQKGWQENNE